MDSVECSFISENKWFRLRSCGILIKEGNVLIIQNDNDPFYYSVGGCVEHGESMEDAALREVWEETGWKFEVERLVFIHENFFRGKAGNIEGLSCHELAFYYLMRWNPDCVITSNSLSMSGSPERLDWLEISQLNNQKMQVYPTFFAKELLILPLHAKHVLTYESAF